MYKTKVTCESRSSHGLISLVLPNSQWMRARGTGNWQTGLQFDFYNLVIKMSDKFRTFISVSTLLSCANSLLPSLWRTSQHYIFAAGISHCGHWMKSQKGRWASGLSEGGGDGWSCPDGKQVEAGCQKGRPCNFLLKLHRLMFEGVLLRK